VVEKTNSSGLPPLAYSSKYSTRRPIAENAWSYE